MKSLFFSKIRYTQRDGIGDKSDEYEHWLRIQKPLRPDDQLDLTETELSEEITKHLDTEYTNYPKNLVVYSFKDYGYVPVGYANRF